MLRILIIDDDRDVRETLKETIEFALPMHQDISVVTEEPLPESDGYAAHLREHDFSALIIDERLNERQLEATGASVSYVGHDVIEALRSRLPDFPVFVVTTWSDDDELTKRWSDFEDIIDRRTFNTRATDYTKRIVRAASRFSEAMQKQLAEMGELSLKAVSGPLSAGEKKRLGSLREALGLPYVGGQDQLLSELLGEARKLSDESKQLLKTLKSKGQA